MTSDPVRCAVGARSPPVASYDAGIDDPDPLSAADADGSDGPSDDSDDGDVAAVLAANEAFYVAFEASDLDAMSEVWGHAGTIACTHPGWATLHGWAEISSSWFALFQQPSPLQFILTDARARVAGDLAWVTVDENLIGAGPGQTVAAVNVFERIDGRWRMVCHHGSEVAPRRLEG